MTRTSPRELILEGSGLYLILTAPAVPHVELATAARDLGVPAIQLREKLLPDLELVRLAAAVADALRGSDTIFIVNDRPDIAEQSGADGVHLGRDDAGYRSARDLLGDGAVIGLSTRTPDEATRARETGADYIGVGPVFPTPTKPDAREPIGLDGLAEVASREPAIPKVAVGGIASADSSSVLAAGAQYVAVISAICHAEDPVAAMRDFVGAIAGAGRERGRASDRRHDH